MEELHPEKKRKPPKGAGGGGGIPGMEGMEGMSGMDDLLRQMKGDFSGEKDPERRRLLEQLSRSGMSFGGGSSMSTEQLRQMAAMMGNIKRDAGKGAKDALATDELKSESDIDDAGIDDEDKMEL